MKYPLETILNRIENYQTFNEQDTFQVFISPIKERTRKKSSELARKFKELI